MGKGTAATALPYDFDTDLMDRVKAHGKPFLRIYPFSPTAVVAGRGSDLAQEIYLSHVISDHIPLYRRKGGGCSVVLDPGNLIVSLAFPAPGIAGIKPYFNGACDWLLAGLHRAGFKGVYRDGTFDLVLEDRKIAGSCFYRTKGAAFFSAALLVSPDLSAMDRYLAFPPRQPDYRKSRPHREFVTGLDRYEPGLTPQILAKRLSFLSHDRDNLKFLVPDNPVRN